MEKILTICLASRRAFEFFTRAMFVHSLLVFGIGVPGGIAFFKKKGIYCLLLAILVSQNNTEKTFHLEGISALNQDSSIAMRIRR